jgi:phosphonate transport system substrate-binding protein
MLRSINCLRIIALPALLGIAIPSPALEGLVLVVQPVLEPAQTIKAYQPLCDYLARHTGQPCRVMTRPNFYAHWETMRKGDSEYNLAVDAAHFTDYRVQKQRWQVLAKIPDSVSYSLITRDNAGILDPADLVGRRIATFGVRRAWRSSCRARCSPRSCRRQSSAAR